MTAGYSPGRDCLKTGLTGLSCNLYRCFCGGKSGRSLTLPFSPVRSKFNSQCSYTHTTLRVFLTWTIFSPNHSLSFFLLIIFSSLIPYVINIISSFSAYIYFSFLFCCFCFHLHRWRIWLMHCATNRKVAGSIPDGVTGIFH